MKINEKLMKTNEKPMRGACPMALVPYRLGPLRWAVLDQSCTGWDASAHCELKTSPLAWRMRTSAAATKGTQRAPAKGLTKDYLHIWLQALRLVSAPRKSGGLKLFKVARLEALLAPAAIHVDNIPAR